MKVARVLAVRILKATVAVLWQGALKETTSTKIGRMHLARLPSDIHRMRLWVRKNQVNEIGVKEMASSYLNKGAKGPLIRRGSTNVDFWHYIWIPCSLLLHFGKENVLFSFSFTTIENWRGSLGSWI
jgi:hypothetical protein